MARIQSVEKAQFINKNIDIYAKNKVGQYSKYLDKTPSFITYYHICNSLSRTDVGTGGIESELGPRSPIRFNKIVDFPVYNIPEIKPEITFDETGYDIDLEMSDIVILPGTIKPSPGDYFILDFPSIKQYLFRITGVRYNTIQSNDFYTVDCDIKDIGQDLELKRMEGQIVDEYQTVFDNIGTQDRCFVKISDIDYLNSIVDLYYKLRDYYKDAFYSTELNAFTTEVGYDNGGYNLFINDPYLETFINRARIYYDENVEETILLSLNTLYPKNFSLDFSRTLYDALLKKSTELLAKYPYAYLTNITKRYSTFATAGVHGTAVNLSISRDIQYPENYVNLKDPNVNASKIIMNAKPGATLQLSDGAIGEEITITKSIVLEGTNSGVAQNKDQDPLNDTEPGIIKYGDPNNPEYRTMINGVKVDNVDISDPNGIYNIPWYNVYNIPKYIPTWTSKCQYMNFDFLNAILTGTIETDDYCELIIFNYLWNIPMKYDRSIIIGELNESLHNYYYIPMVVFVLGQLYQQYFKKESAFEL